MATVDLTTGAEATAPRGRRKFTDELDVSLLKEVSAHNAHTSERGESGHLFDAVAKSLNETRTFPWLTDGKHCADRFNLLIRLFKQKDRTQRAVSGEEYLYGEKEQLMDDMISAIDDANEERRAQRAEAFRRDEELHKAGEAVRDQDISRRRQNGPDNSGNVDGSIDDEPSSPLDNPVNGSGH